MKKQILYYMALFICGSAILSLCGCGALALTDASYCKARMKEYAEAICIEDWGAMKEFHDEKFMWWVGNAKKHRGEAGTNAWQKSLQDIYNRDTFYVHFHKVKKIKEDQILMRITMQAHIVINSMSMVYGNIVWKADVLWVKRGNGLWKLGYIHEISPREKGDPPK